MNAPAAERADSCVDCGDPRGSNGTDTRCRGCADYRADAEKARQHKHRAAEGRSVRVYKCRVCDKTGHNALRHRGKSK